MSVFTAEELEVINKAHTIISLKFERGESFTSPYLVRNYLMTRLAVEEQEVFRVMYLDNQHRLIADVELAKGTLGACTVSAREVVKAALACNAAAVILSHNHPSGVPLPSRADKDVTKRISDALDFVGVRTLDHVIIGGSELYSFAEHAQI